MSAVSTAERDDGVGSRRRGPTGGVTLGRQDLVINLCFHGIGRPGRPLEPDEHLYWVEPAQFDELLEVIRNDPRIHITFDDANASDAAIALPSLLRHGLLGTFFILAGRLDQPGSLSRADVRELARNGMSIGLHGLEHRSWRTLSDDDLTAQLERGDELIAETVGDAIRDASCPFGAYDRRVLRALRRHGYQRVYTTDGGAAARADAWLQTRYTVRARDTPAVIERVRRAPRGTGMEPAVRSVKGFIKRWR